MKIEVKLFFNFAEHLPPDAKNKTAVLSLEDGTSVHGLITQLGLPEEIPKSILVNGRRAGDKAILQENDSVAVFPPMAGG